MYRRKVNFAVETAICIQIQTVGSHVAVTPLLLGGSCKSTLKLIGRMRKTRVLNWRHKVWHDRFGPVAVR